MELVSIIIPCYNEQESLPHLYELLVALSKWLPKYEWEFLFINDGSKDKTLSIIEELYEKDQRVSYVDLSRNFGKDRAMFAGFDYVSGDCAVLLVKRSTLRHVVWNNPL